MLGRLPQQVAQMDLHLVQYQVPRPSVVQSYDVCTAVAGAVTADRLPQEMSLSPFLFWLTVVCRNAGLLQASGACCSLHSPQQGTRGGLGKAREVSHFVPQCVTWIIGG